MRLSTGFIPTVKETPSDAIIPSHQLMIRAGMVRLLSAGIYAWLPLGYKVMKKVIRIVQEEMDAIGGQEFHLPALNPVELWEQTGRVKDFGDNLFHVKNRPLVLAPTHEEVICWIAKNHVESYKDLPQIWYQIQTKFRNEPRPRSGVLRGRQFLMKDSYSLDATWEGLDRSYDLHAQAYGKIFSRCGLKFFVVGASSGAMGGTGSQEFMLESESGEDTIALAEDNSYAANIEVATSLVPKAVRHAESKPLQEVHTPNVKTIDELAEFLKVDHSVLAKSVVYWADRTPVLVLMMGNDEVNESKLAAIMKVPVRPIEPESLRELTGADAGSIGPVGLKSRPGGEAFKIIADKRLEGANGLISGANKNDYHLMNIDLQRDCVIDGYYDLRTVQAGELAPNGKSPLRIVKGIELGHIFKLGTKYSDALGATYLDENGEAKPIIMGSYGIGIERIIACHIEQNHDENGIIWDKAIAPYQVHLIPINMKNKDVSEMSEHLYRELSGAGIEVLYDDRTSVSPGFKFKDADLMGMPYQLIVGEKNLASGKVEIKNRRTGERSLVDADGVLNAVKQLLT
ncbi:MAG TPA: proline--tRNA ligase [Bacteroidota bacterium]|nr:proline--tRNA ligase [Bacteroidota bacterium]